MNKERLMKIVEHLRHGKLGHKVFDFSHINVDVTDNGSITPANGHCGTNGCAMGELPIIWPDQFKFDIVASLTYGTKRWLELTNDEMDYLFYPCSANGLYVDSTKEQVADNIEQYVLTSERIKRHENTNQEID